MKNILLYARYLTYENKKEKLGINELRQAFLDLVDFISMAKEEVLTNIEEILEIELVVDFSQPVVNDNVVLEKIYHGTEFDNILLTPAAKKIIEQLEKTGLSFDTEKIVFFEPYKKEYYENDEYIEEEEYPTSKVHEVDSDEDLKEIGDLLESALNGETEEPDMIERALTIKQRLENSIYGQDNAIEAVVDSIKNKIFDSENSPEHLFLFFGPPATGKTYMSKLIAENLENYEFLELNMAHYQQHHDGIKIFGTEKGWGNESNGYLTSFVKSNPRTLILLDEFEKAHTNIQRRFLSLFSEGYIDDSLGWTQDGETFDSNDDSHKVEDIISRVDFTQTIVIITSNLASELYNNLDFLESLDKDFEKAETMIIQTLQKERKLEANEYVQAIIPEMLSRFSQGKMALFNKLSFDTLTLISKDIFQKKSESLKDRLNVTLVYSEETLNYLINVLLLKFAPYMDTRRIKSKIFENFLDSITDFLVENNITWKNVDKINFNISDSVKEFLTKEVFPKTENKQFLKYLLRKNLSGEIDIEVNFKKRDITYNITNVDFEKVKRVEDTLGNGSINFEVPEVSFNDIAGHKEVKTRLKEIGNLLKDSKSLKIFDAHIPKGMLLYGKPGTGKTMLAQAFANYADIPFIETTANELIDYGSNTLEFLKKVFKRAQDYSPSIIFIDEIDTFGNRETSASSAIINELLTQIDGFNNSKSEEWVFIIAATNRKEVIDEAILRPGRVELHIEVPTLDQDGRRFFLEKILQKPSNINISIDKLIMHTAGMTGAELKKVINESSLYAIRQGIQELTEEIIIEQINIQKYGKRLNHQFIEEMLQETAYHEAGHAVISKLLLPEEKIEQVSIIPRSNALGFVSYDIENSSLDHSKDNLEKKICVLLAGRIAQIKKFKDKGLDDGASNDLAKATKLIHTMTANYGMSPKLGYINIDGITEGNLYFKEEIEKEIKDTLFLMKKQTEQLINNNWLIIEKLAKQLIKNEIIYENEVNSIVTDSIKIEKKKI